MMAAAMGSFGERMRREREMRGITLEEISESTKISSRCLRALEKEEFDKLPGGIFNKGFVRAYARHVGMDEDQAVADFVSASGGEKEQPLPDPLVPRAVALGQSTHEHANWRAFALLVVLLVTAIVAAWKLAPLTFYTVSEAVTSRLKSKTAVSPPPRVTPPPAAETTTATPSAPAPAVQRKPVAQAKPVNVAASTPVAPPAAAPDADNAPAVQTGAFMVQIRAREDAWVQIVADGKLLSEGVLVAPAERHVRATNEVVIRTGNAAGVEVSFNGQPLPSLGATNEAATVTLTAGGVRR
jgi:cytoskeleton protein RodZ